MITKNLPIPVLWIVLIAFLNGNSIAQERTENYFIDGGYRDFYRFLSFPILYVMAEI